MLAIFTGKNGGDPSASLVQGANGEYYGTTGQESAAANDR